MNINKLFSVFICNIVCLLFPFFSISQIISTYAGGGVSECNNCIATETVLFDPGSGVFDTNGNFYFPTSLGGNKILKVNNLGVITTIAGTGVSGFSGDGNIATLAKLNGPESVKIDKVGNIYIADFQNFRIRKVDILTGVISTIAGTGVMGYNGDGIFATVAQISPTDIIIDNIGNILIAEYNSRRVRKIDTNGIIHTIAGNGTVGYSGDGGMATQAQLNPTSLALDKEGNLFVSDPYANVVRKIDKFGIISTIAGNGNWLFAGDGVQATNAQIQPNSVVIDSFGNLYLSDMFNKMIFQVNSSGVLYKVAGNGIAGYSGDGGPATAASLDYLSQLTLDHCNNLYFPDASKGRIRKISFNPDCIPTSVKDVSTTHGVSMKLYPNPTSGEVTVAGKDIGKVAVCTIVGQVVYQNDYIRADKVTVNISNLPSGIYMVRVNDVWVSKVVKE